MPNVNLVVLLGHLGHDPELRFTPKGTPVANLRMATTKRWKDQEGKSNERTEWHRVVVFGQGAEFLKEYGRKGSLVHVEGSLATHEWTDKENVKRYTTEVQARRVQLLTKLKETTVSSPPASDEPPTEAELEEDIPF